jgi:hypothetical protein
MTKKRHHASTHTHRQRRHLDGRLIAAIAGVAVTSGLALWWFVFADNDPVAPASAETPATMVAPITVADVLVQQPSVDLGRVPLNTPESHTFELKNTGATPVSVGKTRIEVLEGCCPPEPPVPSLSTIPPGDHALLTFSLPMGMHPGMDGKHLFRITVPVTSGTGTGEMQLYFRADFRGD